MAHSAQPVHSVLSALAGKKPFLLDFSEIVMLPLGHAITHRPQPLHRSILIIILPAIRINTHKLFYCFFNSWILTGINTLVKTNRVLITVSKYLILDNSYLIAEIQQKLLIFIFQFNDDLQLCSQQLAGHECHKVLHYLN